MMGKEAGGAWCTSQIPYVLLPLHVFTNQDQQVQVLNQGYSRSYVIFLSICQA